MTVTLSRWGNSLAIRIPKDTLEEADMHEGDRLEVIAEEGRLVLRHEAACPSLAELIAGITPENVHASIFDRIVGAEAW
jgi:antitoxin MazE